MKDHYVTYGQAVKLKELGFDWKCTAHYSSDGKQLWGQHQEVINSEEFVSPVAPRLDQAQAWLREVKEIDVLVFNCSCGYGWEISKAGNEQSRGTTIMLYDDNGEDKDSGMWLSYELALSAGIDKALELLKS